MKIAYCIACGCHDFAACHDAATDGPCSWLVVDYDAQLGVCSACPNHVGRWNAGDRRAVAPRHPISTTAHPEAIEAMREPTDDELTGMAWWNDLTLRARAIWLQRAGSAAAVDAWTLFKGDASLATDVAAEEARQLAHGFGDEVALDPVARKRARDLDLDDVLVYKGADGKLFYERIRDIRPADSGMLVVRSGPVGHSSRSCAPTEYVDVVRR